MSEAPQPERPTWGFVILLGLLCGVGPVAVDMYLPSLPQIGRDLHAAPGQGQATMAIFLVGMAIGQLVYGPMSDRVGRRPPVLFGLVVFVAGSIACALATSIELLLAARFLQALGGCAGAVIGRAMVRDRFGHTETARVLSLMMLIIGLAPVLGPLGGAAIMQIGSWRLIFWFMVALGAALALLTLLFIKETRSAEAAAHSRAEHPLQTYLSLFGNRRLVAYALAASLNGALVFTYISSSPELAITIYGMTPEAFSVLFGVNAGGMIVASQINRHLLRRRTPDHVLARVSLVTVVLGLALTFFAFTGIGGKWTFLPLLTLLVSSFGFMQSNTMASALNLDPRRAGAIAAMLGAMQFSVGAVAAWLAGALHDGTPRPTGAVILIAALGTALMLHMFALPRDIAGFRKPRV